MTTHTELVAVLRTLHSQGFQSVRSQTVADRLWPNRQRPSALAARNLLCESNVVREISPDEWKILDDRLKVLEIEDDLQHLREINGIAARDTLNQEFYFWDAMHREVLTALITADRKAFDEAVATRTAVAWLQSRITAADATALKGIHEYAVIAVATTVRQLSDGDPRVAALYEGLKTV